MSVGGPDIGVTAEEPSSHDRALQHALEAVWCHHPDEEYQRDASHWRGHGRWDETSWSALVSTTERRLRDLVRTGGTRVDPAVRVALDWGCGGGASLVALAASCAHLYAVDVSEQNLRESERQVRRLEAAPGVTTILATADPTGVARAVRHPVDIFLSVATFHLLPEKELAAAILRTAYAVMAPGALGYVTIRYDDGAPRYTPRQGPERYVTDHVFASSWGISEFWAVLESIGFTPLKVAHLNLSAHFCSFYFKK